MNENAPGKMLLKVSGILLLIGAIIGIISAITILAGGTMLAGSGVDVAAEAAGLTLAVVGGLGLLLAVFQLITGIMGIRYCKKPEKAKTCIVLGVITVVLALTNLFGGNIVSSLIGLIVPGIYLFGAFKNKQAA